MLTVHRDLVQGSDEWLRARCGMLTASTVGQLLTSTLRVADNATSRGLALRLAAERISGNAEVDRMTADMWRGVDDEPVARDAYAEHVGVDVEEVGLMVREFIGGVRIGYSPDGLVGEDGQIEIKSRAPRHQLETVLSGRVPSEHMAQLQCGLLVSGRSWVDYVSYSGGLHLWVARVTPIPAWHRVIFDAARACESRIGDAMARYLAAAADLPITPRISYDMEVM